MTYFTLVAIILNTGIITANADEFWDSECLKKALKPCGTLQISFKKHKLNQQEQKTMSCRIGALSKCRTEYNEKMKRRHYQ